MKEYAIIIMILKGDFIMKRKQLKNMLAMIGLSLVIGTTGCSKSENKNFAETLEENQDNTCLDDVIKTIEPNLLEKVTMLEQYIDLSNELSKYDIPKMYITEDILNESELLDIIDIKQLYDEYEKDGGTENKDDLLNKLNIQKKLVNKFILDEGYKISSDLALLTLKSKIADSYGLPTTNLTTELANNITIQPYSEYYNGNEFDDTFSIGSKEVLILDDYNEILNQIYDLQMNISNINNNYNYNEDRNIKIKNAIGTSRKMISKNYTLRFKK